ncbi:MAG TPA: DUF4132 domain-containing protein [Ktedonobacterales bacterium]|nr:DUF4132 domain-containing protein [Ktedonobacterales bacterium]
MQATERIEAIAQQCRPRYNPYPESLITAICQYVSGNGSLTTIQQEWSAAGRSTTLWPDFFIVVSDPNTEQLDEMDLRILDICIITGSISGFFSRIAAAGPVEQARDYLRAKGIDESSVIESIMNAAQFYDNTGSPTALGRLLLLYIPVHFKDILQTLPTISRNSSRHCLFRLLLITQPEAYLDMAWQVAKTASVQEADGYAAELLKADPTRFTDWTRQVARDTIQHNQLYHYQALETLLKLSPAQHIDLAIEAAKAPLPTHSWNRAELQRIGVEAAYRLDSMQYLALVEGAAVSSNPYLGKHAVELLKEADFEQARPILQRCVASGDIEVALKALDTLLKQQWPERQQYMLSLLSHRSKQLRDALTKWFMQEVLQKDGKQLIEALAPYLAHSNADARLTAVQALVALQPIDAERARALLAARLDVEKSLKVKQAILDVVGVAAVAASSEPATASHVEALSAEAEAALKRVAKPALPWFEAAQMPGLRWKDGGPIPQVVVNYLLYLQSRVKQNTLDTRIQQALPLIDRGASGDLALALFNGWMRQGAASAEAWCLPFVCALADERLVYPLRQSIDGWAKGVRGAIAAKAVAAMALIESDLALAEINDLAERAKHSQVKAAAQKALTDAANHRSITLDELADLIVPNLGLDEHGQRLFDYGPRQFTVRLQLDQTIQITDNTGKRLTTLPKPGAHDDESKAKAALVAWSMLKKHVPQVMKMQAQRLENALISQRAWSVARWQALFLKHPVLRSFAITLVWGVTNAESLGYQLLFRPLEDSSLTDTEDNAIELPTEGQIRIVHPLDLDEAMHSAWLQHLSDYEVTSPFPQVNRPVVRVNADERDALWWETYKGYVMNGGALKGRFLKSGWERGSVQDAGVYYTIWKAFPDAGIQAVLETAGLAVASEQGFNTAIKRLAFARIDTIKRGSYIYDDLQERDVRIIKLGEVPPIIFSEIAADVQTFAAAGEYTEDWERKVW